MTNKMTAGMITPHSDEKIRVYFFVSCIYGLLSTLKKANKALPDGFTIDYEPFPEIEKQPETEFYNLGASIATDYIKQKISAQQFIDTVRELPVLLDHMDISVDSKLPDGSMLA